MENNPLSRATSLLQPIAEGQRTCKFKPCGEPFWPKRKDQVFHTPACKTKHTMLAYGTGLKIIDSRGMHAARIERSERLQNIYTLLVDGKWHSGLEIALAGPTTAPGSAIQELKHPINGFVIESRCEKRTANNRPLWEYRLVKEL